MKKIIPFLIGILLLSANLLAQTTMTASSATNTNAVSQTHTTALSGEINNYDNITIQVVGTKVSGTPAGSAKLYGSIDGTNYQLITTAADTLAIANQTTNSYFWNIDKTRYKYYKVTVTTTGTQVSTWAAYLLGRKTPKLPSPQP